MPKRATFIDRPIPIALLEQLYHREASADRHLPIILVIGTGGSGRTRLLDYLYSRAKEPLTCARVRARPDGGPRSLLELLDALQEELALDRHPQCGLISFPRFELGRWMREAAADLGPHPDPEEIKCRFRELLNRRFRAPNDVGHAAQNIIVIALQWLVGLMLPAFLTRPSLIRRLLWGKHRETGFRWYERDQQNVELPENRHFDDVVRRVCTLVHAAGPEAEDDIARVDELLLSAFLEDLRAAYDPKRTPNARLRTAQCVALLDDIDRVPDGQGFRLLDMVARHRAGTDRRDPLILIATTQVRWRMDGAMELGGNDTDPSSVHELYVRWRDHVDNEPAERRSGSLFITTELRSLTREETRAVALSGEDQPSLADDVLGEEIYQATYGHPDAIDLVLRARAGRRVGAERLGVRRLMNEALPDDLAGQGSGVTIGKYLLDRFYEPARSRIDLGVLAACAFPRTLDVPAVRAALGYPDDETGRLQATEVWQELSRYAFCDRVDETTVSMHPLMRDLLIRLVAADTDERSPLSYGKVQSRLTDHFAVLAREHPPALVDRLYHELGLGREQSVLHRLGEAITPTNRRWRVDLLEIVRAPAKGSPGRFAEMRSRLAALPWRPDGSLEELLDHGRQLYSATSDTAWSIDLVDDLTGAVDDLVASWAERGMTVPDRETFDEHVIGLDPPEPTRAAAPRPVSRLDEDEPFACLQLRSRRGLRRAAVAVALVAPVLAYFGAYYDYSLRTCGAAGVREFRTVITDLLVRDEISVYHTGGRGRGECIGITSGDHVFAPSTRGVQRAIAAENAWVMRRAEAGDPYVTAVVLTTLSSSQGGAPALDVAAGRSELEGVYLAQRQYNRVGHVPRLRVLVANAGLRSGHAGEVARQIVRLAERDPTVVAVLGFGQGRGQTLDAVRILGDAGLPMVASTASDDELTGVSQHFFRVVAPNRAQAAVAASFAKNALNLRSAVIVHDPNDRSSAGLARDFRRAFVDEQHRIGWPMRRFDFDSRRAAVANVLAASAARACLMEPGLIYYAGRAEGMAMLLDGMAEQAACDHKITVMGGHSLSLLGSSRRPVNPPQLRNPVYFTAMSVPDAWRPGREPAFYREYRDRFAKNGGRAPLSYGFADLSYDATKVLTSALTDSAVKEPDAFTVWRRIALTTGLNKVSGTGGIIDFGSAPTGDPEDRAVMLLRVSGSKPVRWIGSCGNQSDDPAVVAVPRKEIPCPKGLEYE